MAEVTEVIHHISYQVNDEPLQNVTKAIQLQIAELDKLNKQLNSYSAGLSKLSQNEGKQLDELTRKIDDVSQKVARSAAKTEGLLQQSIGGALKGFDLNDNLKDAIADYVKSVRGKFKELAAASRELGTATKGMWTSNATHASQGAKKTSSALKLLTGSLGSATGLLDIGINLLLVFGEELLESGNKVGILTGKVEALNAVNKAAAGDIATVSTEIDILKARFFDAEASVDSKKAVVAELNEKYGDTIGHLNGISDAEDFFINKSGAFVQAMTLRAQIQGAYATIAENYQKLLEARAADPEDNLSGLEYYWNLARSIARNPAELVSPIAFKVQTGIDFSNNLKDANKEVLKEAEADFEKLNETISEKVISLSEQYDKILKDNGFNKGGQSLSPPKPTLPKREKEDPIEQLETRSAISIEQDEPRLDMDNLKAGSKVTAPPIKQEEEQKGLTEQQKENIQKGIEGYEQLAQAAADAYNKILDAQIAALDKEIALREKRVEAAKKLAERGNTEALRIEEERLQKAMEQRERFARRQQAVNAAITVSNAIAAVARAALEGGGFGSVATIAALLAAMAAGYAAVTSLSQDAGAFADGVVDYKGKGGPRDDKNWVRISSGESVITAEGTKKNRTLLEAINKGAALHMMDPSLPLMMPAFKQPGIQPTNNYASAKDLGKLERKLDDVVDAIEDNRLKQNIFFNEQGVGLMTERAIRKDRNRWK